MECEHNGISFHLGSFSFNIFLFAIFQVWSMVGIDLMGPFPKTRQGNKYIVAASDLFSKWTEARPIPSKEAKQVVGFLQSICCRLGPMDIMIADQGREFVNQEVRSLTEELEIEHRKISPYHPQSNGQRERDNITLKTCLQISL